MSAAILLIFETGAKVFHCIYNPSLVFSNPGQDSWLREWRSCTSTDQRVGEGNLQEAEPSTPEKNVTETRGVVASYRTTYTHRYPELLFPPKFVFMPHSKCSNLTLRRRTNKQDLLSAYSTSILTRDIQSRPSDTENFKRAV